MSNYGSTTPSASERFFRLHQSRRVLRGLRDQIDSKNTFAWFLVLPSALLVALVTFMPVLQALALSFRETNFLVAGSFIGLKHYEQFLIDPLSAKNFLNSLTFTFSSLVFAVPLATLLALLLNRSFPGRTFFRTVLILPWVTSQLLTALLWRFVDSPIIGPLAYLLGSLTNSQVDILGTTNTAMIGVILANVWRTFPYAMVLLLASLQTIPEELYEAAGIDGATAWCSFRYITFPLIQNTLLIVIITLSIHYFNMVELPLVMTGGGPVNATDVLGLRVFREAFVLFRFGFGAAIAMVMFAINIFASLAYIRALRVESYY